MNKLLSLLLVFLCCLSIVGCKQSPVSTGERNVSSPTTGDEISETAPASEDVLPSDMETEMPVSAAQSTNNTDSEVAVPSAPPVKPSETAPATSSNAPVSSTAPATSIPTPVSSEPFTPAAFFCPPDYPSVYEHTEYSFDDFIAWINSDKALIEEDGVYRAAVEYWRKRGAVCLASLPQDVSKIKWWKLYSDGRLCVTFEDGYIIICPFNENEVAIAKDGINSYFQAKGNTLTTNTSTNSMELANKALTTRFITRSTNIASKVIDTVLEIRPYELSNDQITYIRILHWFQNGFHMSYWFRSTNSPEKSPIIDDSILSQLQFQDIALSGSIRTKQ